MAINKPPFEFIPLPNDIDKPGAAVARPAVTGGNPLAPVSRFLNDNDEPATWVGKGLNVIWRPFHKAAHPTQHHFLELNLTDETLAFKRIPGKIPNRGLLQDDIVMFGVTYQQQISDAVVGAGLHIEPGIWAKVGPTSDPLEPETVVRMGSIPHGTTILAQGISPAAFAGPPPIKPVSIKPFPIGDPSAPITFPEQDLSTPTEFRSDPAQIVGITQGMVDNPNSVLTDALAGLTVIETIATFIVSTDPASPVLGGGTANTAFLQGAPSSGPNAQNVTTTAIFWVEHVKDASGKEFFQIQYTQTVILNFGGLSWPHVTVGTLVRQ